MLVIAHAVIQAWHHATARGSNAPVSSQALHQSSIAWRDKDRDMQFSTTIISTSRIMKCYDHVLSLVWHASESIPETLRLQMRYSITPQYS
jgi:hypothetical protein